MPMQVCKKWDVKCRHFHCFLFYTGYKGFRPWMILSNIMMIAMTSNIWIKLPTKPSENPNSQSIIRITIIVPIMI